MKSLGGVDEREEGMIVGDIAIPLSVSTRLALSDASLSARMAQLTLQTARLSPPRTRRYSQEPEAVVMTGTMMRCIALPARPTRAWWSDPAHVRAPWHRARSQTAA